MERDALLANLYQLTMAKLRIILLVLGLVTLVALIWHSGPARIAHTVTQIGFSGLTIILLLSILIYWLDTLGWRFTLAQYSFCVPFFRLFLIRMAGEAVNLTTPTAYRPVRRRGTENRHKGFQMSHSELELQSGRRPPLATTSGKEKS